MLFELADCLVPYGWKKEQDDYEREHGREREEAAPPPSPVPVYPRLGLSEAARLAREAGMTYGMYMAKRGIFPPPPKYRKLPPYLRTYLIHCEVCGGVVPPRRKKFCCDACMHIAKQRRASGAQP